MRVLDADLRDAVRGRLGIGGRSRTVAFTTLEIELLDDPLKSNPDVLASWNAEVGFLTHWEPTWSVIVGQSGFFDEFTVTMHRVAHALVVEPWETSDARFGLQIERASKDQPRFSP